MVETLDLTFIPANLCLNPFGFQNVHIVLNLVSKYLKHEYPELPVDRYLGKTRKTLPKHSYHRCAILRVPLNYIHLNYHFFFKYLGSEKNYVNCRHHCGRHCDNYYID